MKIILNFAISALLIASAKARVLSAGDITQMKGLFRMADKDGNGSMNTQEFGGVFNVMGQSPSPSELQETLNGADNDGNGTIDVSEFLEMVSGPRPNFQGETEEDRETRHKFKSFDHDGNGKIDRSELKKTLIGLGEILADYELDDALNRADFNGDGELDFDEFKRIIN
jgi:calmodulin